MGGHDPPLDRGDLGHQPVQLHLSRHGLGLGCFLLEEVVRLGLPLCRCCSELPCEGSGAGGHCMERLVLIEVEVLGNVWLERRLEVQELRPKGRRRLIRDRRRQISVEVLI